MGKQLGVDQLQPWVLNVMTFAHEMGHAWHDWVMRDMPVIRTAYLMTLAETASIFAETLVRDALINNAESAQLRREIAWANASAASALMLNIPARFSFEQALVEARAEKFVPAAQLKSIMGQSWKHWYEDTLGTYDEMFWASKLHFSISGLGFYYSP